MEVQEKLHLFVLGFQLFDQVGQPIDLRVQKFAKFVEFAIKISAAKTSSVIASNNTVRVDHGHHIEITASQQPGSHLGVLEQSSDDSLQHVGGVGLTRVYPGCDDDAGLGGGLLL